MTKLSLNPKYEELLNYLARMFKPVNNFDELDEFDQKQIFRHTGVIWNIVREGLKG